MTDEGHKREKEGRVSRAMSIFVSKLALECQIPKVKIVGSSKPLRKTQFDLVLGEATFPFEGGVFSRTRGAVLAKSDTHALGTCLLNSEAVRAIEVRKEHLRQGLRGHSSHTLLEGTV